MDILERVLKMDLDNLTAEEHKWLHDLKNKAAVLSASVQLRELKAKHELVRGEA